MCVHTCVCVCARMRACVCARACVCVRERTSQPEARDSECAVKKDSQDVADDSDAPHVGGVADSFIVDHFWGNKLRSPKQNLQSSGIFCHNRQ